MARSPGSVAFKSPKTVQKTQTSVLIGRIVVDAFAVAALFYIVAFRILNLF